MDLMNQVFKPYLDEFVVVFIDDVLIYSKNAEAHEGHLRLILQTLQEKELYAKLKKCELWLQKVAFLGHVITKDGVSVDPHKIEAIVNWPTPTNVTEIHYHLGKANTVADALSRKNVRNLENLFTEQKELMNELDKMKVDLVVHEQEAVVAAVMAQPTLLEEIKQHQMEDETLRKGYLSDLSHIIDYHQIVLDDKLAYEEKPIRILDQQVKQLRNREIPMGIKVN
ncbi:uncharacterized protein LOC114279376 [Camellia sinensis]|uniref:uncharacterized protein LOC114279376 n=1 Tax=Camellia sinensis TaxID=4442 RepID=UPI001036ED33|nr:uncharacterized protein LOC114279376 [Camellia sinensis]